MPKFTSKSLAGFIDHTLLKKDLKKEDIYKICMEAVKYGFYGVCIYSEYISWAKEILADQKPIIIAVIDFPEGKAPLEEKMKEGKEAVASGAQELDMVLNRDLLKQRELQKLYQEISAVVNAAQVPVKVIIETCALTDEEKIMACAIAKAAGALFVKTSTGMKEGGATAVDVRLMKNAVGITGKVKASGKIRDLKTALSMIEAGADRIGTSSSVGIMEEFLY